MDARGFALRDEPVGDRLAGVALLDADGEAGEVVDGSDVRQPSGVDGQRLSGDQVWRDELRLGLPTGCNGGARGDAVVSPELRASKMPLKSAP